MKISIIICTRNRAASLDETLGSLENIAIPPGLSCEVLVVHDGLADGTRDLVQKRRPGHWSIRYVLEPARGLSRARNAGLLQSTGEIIILTDDDIRFPKDWLLSMCEPIIAKKADAIAGNIELAPNLQRTWMTAQHRTWLASTEGLDLLEPSVMVGANMAFSRSVLEMVPSFDPELGAGSVLGFGEETLFSFQIKEAGRKIGRSTGPPVVHCFDEKRLSRDHWLQAARGRGATFAYFIHHWNHEALSLPRLRYYYVALKLGLRRLLDPPRPLRGEGIAAWEMSYIVEMEKCRQFLIEQQRPRNYSRRGLKKHGPSI